PGWRLPGWCRGLQVVVQHDFGGTILAHAALIEPDHPRAPGLHDGGDVGGQYEDLGAAHHVLEPDSGTLEEGGVAGQDPLIHQQDLRANGGGEREGEADHHARGVDAHGKVEEVAKVGEAANVVGQTSERGARQPVVEAAQHDVLPPGQVEVHAELHVEQRVHAALDADAADHRLID